MQTQNPVHIYRAEWFSHGMWFKEQRFVKKAGQGRQAVLQRILFSSRSTTPTATVKDAFHLAPLFEAEISF